MSLISFTRGAKTLVHARPSPRLIRAPLTRGLRSKSEISVELKETIPEVGKAGDIIKVRAGYMRNFLFRYGKAKYIPHERVILPFADKKAMLEENAVKQQQQQALLEQQTSISMMEQERTTQVLRQRLEQLRRLSPLKFTRKARGAAPSAGTPDRRAIFGSVSIDDVLLRLREAHQIAVERAWVSLASTDVDSGSNDRIRQLGGARFAIQIPGVGTTTLRVMVEAEQEAGETETNATTTTSEETS
ncbi:hypothetical protein BDF19DRAFT_439191 [Syncephalis fuscata]|nr:hypothetical protein BDF19DRAFT_439191 [Syncephalis fuscata]